MQRQGNLGAAAAGGRGREWDRDAERPGQWIDLPDAVELGRVGRTGGVIGVRIDAGRGLRVGLLSADRAHHDGAYCRE